MLVGYGCPSADKKVVFSAKLLRKHVHLDEGDVSVTYIIHSFYLFYCSSFVSDLIACV